MVIDGHCHIFPDSLAERAMERLSGMYGVDPVRLPTLAGVLAEMEEHGVDRAVALQIATKPEQVRTINDWAVELAANPRLVPMGALHPGLPHHEIEVEVDRLVAAGIRGVKLQPYFQQYDPLSPEALDMLRRIGDRLIVIIHAGEEMLEVRPLLTTPERMARLHDAVPKLRFIMAHLGGYRRWDEALAHLAGRDVYLDISYTLHCCPKDLALRILEAHGTERVVWGSDFPWAPMDYSAVEELGLGAGETAGMLGENLRRLMGI
jgi:uncharacterized protein